MSLTAEQLISIAHCYWQSFKDYNQEPSPEDERRFALCEQKLQEHGRWLALLMDLRRELPESSIGDYTGGHPCFCCVAYPSRSPPQPALRWAVVGCVSFLAPVYTLYGVQFDYSNNDRIFKQLALWPLPYEVRTTAAIIATKLEAAFEVTALPHELAQLPVPLFVEFTEPPKTTLFHALFMSNPENLP
jgi:hypothetical protein